MGKDGVQEEEAGQDATCGAAFSPLRLPCLKTLPCARNCGTACFSRAGSRAVSSMMHTSMRGTGMLEECEHCSCIGLVAAGQSAAAMHQQHTSMRGTGMPGECEV
eukprot:354664-Chlamydomonas_euryale.AAC.2